MSHPASQDIKNHARYVPIFHFVAGPILLVNLVYSIVLVVKDATWDNIDNALVAGALMILFFTVRGFATRVQDRVIRLEEQILLDRLFPTTFACASRSSPAGQYIALRFASDSELPNLARAVLDQRITDQSAIKQMVKEWRADHLRV